MKIKSVTINFNDPEKEQITVTAPNDEYPDFREEAREMCTKTFLHTMSHLLHHLEYPPSDEERETIKNLVEGFHIKPSGTLFYIENLEENNKEVEVSEDLKYPDGTSVV